MKTRLLALALATCTSAQAATVYEEGLMITLPDDEGLAVLNWGDKLLVPREGLRQVCAIFFDGTKEGDCENITVTVVGRDCEAVVENVEGSVVINIINSCNK